MSTTTTRHLCRIILFATVVVLAVAGGAAFAAHLNALPNVGVSSRPQYPGQPAIAVTRPGHVPAFTEADVRAYYTLSHGYPGGRMLDGSEPPIQSIAFMSREQAEANIMHHGSLSELPADALVCVVMARGPLMHVGLTGPGYLSLPGTPSPTPAPPRSIPSGYMIFDASTGNLVVYGF